MSIYLFSSDRLEFFSLSPDNREDNDAFSDFWLSDGEAFSQYRFGRASFNAKSDEEIKKAKDYLHNTRYLRFFSDDGAVFFRQKGQKLFIGGLGLTQGEHYRLRQTYFLNPSYRGQGFMSEAYQAFEEQYIGLMGKVTYAEVAADNEGGLRLLFKQGFKTVKSISRLDARQSLEGRGKDILVLRR